MAMLPFCGYNMADYWNHWLEIGARKGAQLPRIYYVNWFRKNADGDFMWPGFGDNGRVLKWIFERVSGKIEGQQTPIGIVPAPGELDLSHLPLDEDDIAELTSVDVPGWLAEIPLIRDYYAQFGDRLPKALVAQLDALEERLRAAGA